MIKLIGKLNKRTFSKHFIILYNSYNIYSFQRKATVLKKRESIILEVKPSMKTCQILGTYLQFIDRRTVWNIYYLSINISIHQSINLSIYLAKLLIWTVMKLDVNTLVDFIIIQITDSMIITRQVTMKTQRMRCQRKLKEDPRQIKIFLSETSWHRFQTCLQTKTLDSKVNTMYDLLIQHHYLTYLHCLCFYLNFQ